MSDRMSHVEALEAIGYHPSLGWVCGVVRSGYHNGARCNPHDPCHAEEWECGYRAELSIRLTAEQAKEAGALVP